jgi:hypothetical protein
MVVIPWIFRGNGLKYGDFWRGVREAEGARLESVCTLTGTQGSNPCLSANVYYKYRDFTELV